MKYLAPYALSLLFCTITLTSFSQNNSKPKQFNNFPGIINCSESELARIFNTAAGQQMACSFSDGFIFSGTVINNIVKYSNLQTAVITSPEYSNTIFNISKITNNDGSLSYIGRIINKNYYDGFELKKNTAGDYQLIKVETDRVIPDCVMQ